VTDILHDSLCTFVTISRWILLRVRNVSDSTSRENPNTQFVFGSFFPRKLCRLWDNVETRCTARQSTDDNIIRRMRFACWVSKATNTHLQYVILIAFALQQRLHERASVSRCPTWQVLSLLRLGKCQDDTSDQATTTSFHVCWNAWRLRMVCGNS